MGREQGAAQAGGIHPARGLGRAQQLVIGTADALLGLSPQPLQLRLGAREREGASGVEVALNPLARDGLADLRDRALDRRGHRPRPTVTASPAPAAGRPSDLAEHPATVAAGGPEARVLRFEHDDVELRRRAAQLVRRPQAGEAGADDADIGVTVVRQRRPWLDRPYRVQPVARRRRERILRLGSRIAHSRDATQSLRLRPA